MKYLLLLLSAIHFLNLMGQPNCNTFEGDCKKACEIATKPAGGQGSRSSQIKFDRALELCPDGLAYAYMQKAVPYLKRGDFITWKQLIDRAVAIDPLGQLGYRGWCRFQFLRDYQAAIDDLQQLEKLMPGNIGYSQNGDYHLKTAMALCYKQLGILDSAILILENHTSAKSYEPWAYEFLHLGVIYLEANKVDQAILALKKQLDANDYLAETYYYLALAYQQKQSDLLYKENMLRAKDFYNDGKMLFDVYTTMVDAIDLTQIESHTNSWTN
ncbi:MAG: hypothetical protein AAF616_13560 [Bacteroidota bacterium]